MTDNWYPSRWGADDILGSFNLVSPSSKIRPSFTSARAARMEEIAQEKVYEFCLIAAPLKIKGGTGSPVRLLAVT